MKKYLLNLISVCALAQSSMSMAPLPGYIISGTNAVLDTTVEYTWTAPQTFSGGATVSTLQTKWVPVSLDGTNAVIDLASGANFYYTLSTSNHITFSNLVSGANGALLIYGSGTGNNVNFSSSYDNWSTNEIAPPFSVTNRVWIGYQVTFGTNATNVALAIKRK